MSRYEWEKFVLWCLQWEFGNHLHFEYYHYDVKNNTYEDVDAKKFGEYIKVDVIEFDKFILKDNTEIYYLENDDFNEAFPIATNRSVEKMQQFIVSLT